MSHPGEETSLDAVLDLVPALAGVERKVADLEGGLTNRNHKVTTADGAYVVRRWSDDGALLSIDRDNEHQNSIAAAEAGIGAPVVAYLPEQKALVIEFIDGPTLSADEFRDGSWMEPVAEACRRLHSAESFRDDFDMFEIQAGYLRLVEERDFRLPERYRDFEPHLAEIREVMRAHPERLVPCNNDLLAENFIDSPDGLRLIDYEYSGNNEPSFELGNIWSESNLSLDQLDQLVGAYWGEAAAGKVARARLWGLMSKYGWTLWASIQDGVSDIDFDFWAWGMEKYERAMAEFDGSDFTRLLDETRAG